MKLGSEVVREGRVQARRLEIIDLCNFGLVKRAAPKAERGEAPELGKLPYRGGMAAAV